MNVVQKSQFGRKVCLTGFLLLGVSLLMLSAASSDTLRWDAKNKKVTASFRDWPIDKVLAIIKRSTKWEVKVPEDSGITVSGTFKDLPPHLALQKMFGHLNYAVFSPPKGGKPRLQIFLPVEELAKDEKKAPTPAKSATPTARRNPFAKPTDPNKPTYASVMKRFDKNGDGVISDSEREAAKLILANERK